ncbi:hypothetical protein AAG906_029070 [Vitis piasezkii]
MPPNLMKPAPEVTSHRGHPIESFQQRISIVTAELLSQLQDWNNRRQFAPPSYFHADAVNEYSKYIREEILGRNCRFLQAPETDQGTVAKIRDAIRQQREIIVQLINCTERYGANNLFLAWRHHVGQYWCIP